MRLYLAITSAAFIALPSGAIAGPVEDAQVWTVVTVSGPVKRDIVFAAEAQARVINNISRHGQTLFRGSLGVRAKPNLTLSLGYANTEIFRNGAPDSVEQRLFQQVAWTIGPALGGTLSTRARMEQRWFKGFDDTGWRYRQTLRLQIPVNEKGVAFVTQSEIFFNLNDTDAGARSGFDQLRGLVGISVPLSKSVTLDAGYQPIYIKGTATDRLNHTFPITLAIRL